MTSKPVKNQAYGSVVLHETLDQTRFEKVPVLVMDPSQQQDLSSLLEKVDRLKINGIPFVIKGHADFFPPGVGWVKETGELDVEAMKDAIGKANVSVIDKQYNGEFKGSMTVTNYVENYWTPGNDSMYMHQYQFPLDTNPGTLPVSIQLSTFTHLLCHSSLSHDSSLTAADRNQRTIVWQMYTLSTTPYGSVRIRLFRGKHISVPFPRSQRYDQPTTNPLSYTLYTPYLKQRHTV